MDVETARSRLRRRHHHLTVGFLQVSVVGLLADPPQEVDI